MTNELLSALNAVLFPLSAFGLYNFSKYLYVTRDDKKDPLLMIYSWSVFCMFLGVFVSSVLFFAYDFDLIYRSVQMKFAVIPRSLFIAASLLAYQALDIKWRQPIVLLSILFGFAVFTVKILL